MSEDAVGRLLLVSNRLPVTVSGRDGEARLERSSGGLASGLASTHAKPDTIWIGWPGELPMMPAEKRHALDDLLAEMRIVPVYLSRNDIKGFYEDVANGVLWPVMHYRLDQLPIRPTGWETFRRVNEVFAEAVIATYRPGDMIWVHDYHLVLVPQMLRKALPGARIGYFHHIPFPGADIFSVIPWRDEILEGLLGADLVGFHVPEFGAHFRESCRRVLKTEASESEVVYRGRTTLVGAFPLGINKDFWSDISASEEVAAQAEQIRLQAAGRKVIVGIDRLDYTKGVLRRFAALELLFQEDPTLVDKVRFIQVVFPSREAIEYYSNLRKRIDEYAGKINGEYGTTASAPIHLLNRNLPVEDTAALYKAADVMMVTPLRDGMNLVSKEFIACREQEDGVLILSEFAGAVGELEGALIVNPYDVDGLAGQLKRALQLPLADQQARMRRLRTSVATHDADAWAESYLSLLSGESQRGELIEASFGG